MDNSGNQAQNDCIHLE